MKKRNNRGFTLIELIIAIVLIGIVGAISIPRIIDAQDRARVSAAECDITSMEMALAQYDADYGSYKVEDGSYVGAIGYEEFKTGLKDPRNMTYMTLPDTTNFYPNSFNFAGNSINFKITVKAKDSKKTTLIATRSTFIALSHFQEQVLDYLGTSGAMTSEFGSSEFKVPLRVAKLELDELVDEKLLSKGNDELNDHHTAEQLYFVNNEG